MQGVDSLCLYLRKFDRTGKVGSMLAPSTGMWNRPLHLRVSSMDSLMSGLPEKDALPSKPTSFGGTLRSQDGKKKHRTKWNARRWTMDTAEALQTACHKLEAMIATVMKRCEKLSQRHAD